MTTNINDEMVTIAESAKILGLSEIAIYQLNGKVGTPDPVSHNPRMYKRSDIIDFKEWRKFNGRGALMALPSWTRD